MSSSVESSANQPSGSSSSAQQNARKRRITTLPPIDLSGPSTLAAKLSGSNESLNSNSSAENNNAYGAYGIGRSSASIDDESTGNLSRGVSPPTVISNLDKRARLASQTEAGQPSSSYADVHINLAELECSQDGSSSVITVRR